MIPFKIRQTAGMTQVMPAVFLCFGHKRCLQHKKAQPAQDPA